MIVECYLCGTFGETTAEHVFPRCLFSKPRPNNLLTLPACHGCNSGLALDDEYFRDFIATASKDPNLWRATLASLRRPDAVGRRKDMAGRIVETPVKVGPFTAPLTGVRFDAERIQRVLKRMVAGLHYHHFGIRLPANTTFRIDDLDQDGLDLDKVGEPLRRVMLKNRTQIGPLFYTWAQLDQPFGAWWYIGFYDSLFAKVATWLDEPPIMGAILGPHSKTIGRPDGMEG